MARVPKAAREGTKAAIQAINDTAGGMPQSRREKLTAFVKWRESEVEKSVACHNQCAAEQLALKLLARADIQEVFFVLHIKKVK